MIRSISVFLIIICFYSCGKEAPMVEVRLTIPPHDRWGEIGLNMGFVELYQFEDNKLEAIFSVDNFTGQSVVFQLDKGFERTLVFTEQRPRVVTAIKPNINDVFVRDKDGQFLFTNLYAFDEIYLPSPVIVEDGYVYLIDITMDMNSIIEVDSTTLDFFPEMEVKMLQR